MSEEAKQVDDGGLVTPVLAATHKRDDGSMDFVYAEGMTVRDYVAIQMMQGLVSRVVGESEALVPDFDEGRENHVAALVARSFKIADAFIAARKAGGK